jgi:hypothetical protein
MLLEVAAVSVLVPYVKLAASAAAGGLAKKIGSVAADRLASLFDGIRARLNPAARQVLADFERNPDQPPVQAALQYHLASQLAEDPALHAELTALIEELRANHLVGIEQISSIIGDQSVNIQIAGSGNQVRGPGKLP